MNRPPGKESARELWREAVKAKPRQDWQLSQWAEGTRWYLKWFEICCKAGGGWAVDPGAFEGTMRPPCAASSPKRSAP